MSEETDREEKPTPPIPPTSADVIPNAGTKRRLDREAVERCDCGGMVWDEQIATGHLVVGSWDEADFDSEEWKLHTEWDQTENEVRCDRCGWGYDY